MLNVSLTWQPDSETLHRLMKVAVTHHSTLEEIFEAAIQDYLDMKLGKPLPLEDDPILSAMYDGSPDLGERAEELLEADLGGGQSACQG